MGDLGFLVFSSGLIILLALLFRYKRDVIEIFETSIRFLLAEAIFFIWIMGSAISGLFLTSFILALWWYPKTGVGNPLTDGPWGPGVFILPLFGLLQLLIFLYPLLCSLYAYFTVDKYYRGKFQLLDSPPEEEAGWFLDVRKKVEELANELQIKSQPRIVCSNLADVPVHIYKSRASSGGNVLILPRNFDQLISFSTQYHTTPNRAKEVLLKFILLHELSHIKNKDTAFTSFVIPFMQAIKDWPLVLLADLGVALFVVVDSPFQGWIISSFVTQTILFILSLTFFYLLVISGQRHKEYLADSRAAIHLSQEEREGLLTRARFPSLGDKTVLEVFFWLTTRGSLWGKSLFGFIDRLFSKCRSWLSKFSLISSGLSYLSTAHPKSSRRVAALSDQRFWNEERYYPSRESALLSGFSLTIWLLLPAVEAGLISQWTAGIESIASFTLPYLPPLDWILGGGVLFGSLGSLLIALTFSLPLANSFHWTIKLSDLRVLLIRYGLMILSSAALLYILVTVLTAVGEPGFVVGPELGGLLSRRYWVLVGEFGPIFILLPLLMLQLVRGFFEEHAKVDQTKIQAISALPGATLFSIYTLWILFHDGFGPELSTYFELTMVWFAGCFELFLLHREWTFYSSGGEVIHLSVGRWHRSWRPGRRKIFWFNQVFVGILLIVPIVLWHFVFKHWMINMGLDRFSYLVAGIFFGIFALEIYLNPIFQKRPPQRLFYLTHLYRQIIGEKELASLPIANLKRVLFHQQTEYGSFGHGYPDRFGSMDQTYYAVRTLGLLNSPLVPPSKTLDWILDCSCPEGGFGRFPHGEPRLSSTHQALCILSHLGQNPSAVVDSSKHAQWLLDQRGPEGLFVCPFLESGPLKDTFHAVRALSHLEKNYLPPDLASKVFAHWKEGQQTVEATFYALSIVSNLDIENELFLKEVKDKWYPLAEKRVLNTRIDRQWERIYMFSLICERLGVSLPEDFQSELSQRIVNTVQKL